jgi:dTDP-4-amino-4,6-dideoxygalactose transaminase
MISVPLLDLKAQYDTIRNQVREAMDRVCETQHFIMGPEVSSLELEIAEFCGAAFAIGVSSGTDALLAALMALEVAPGDEVITTTYSFFATAGVIARLNARPVFVDIDPVTFNLDVTQISGKITDRTKVILPVHLFGRCADMDPILAVADAYGLAVVEDAAQAIGAHDVQGRQAGVRGSIGCFSFFPSKNLGAYGDAGMVVTNDPTLADRLALLRVHGGRPKYHHRLVGGNFRLDALQAAVLRVKLQYLPAWTDARRRNADRYRDLFSRAGLTTLVELPEDVPGHIYHQFVVRVSSRDRLQEVLSRHGVSVEVYYPIPLHMQECFAPLGYSAGDFPHAELAATECLALPIYPELLAEQQEYVVRTFLAFFESRNEPNGTFSVDPAWHWPGSPRLAS